MVSTAEEVVEVGKKLGYTDDDIQVVIDRAGSTAVALRRLKAKLAQQERWVSKKHDERIAAREAEHAQVRHAKTQAKARAERQVDRGRMTLPQRLAACLEMAATLPTLSTGSMAGGGISVQKDSAAPPAAGSEAASFYLVRVVALIGNMEREFDAELHGADAAAETIDARDLRIVRDYEGWAAYEVATFDRSVGSPDTVERARRKHGRMPQRGHRPPEAVVA